MPTERPPECTMRLRVLEEVQIPSIDERYHFRQGHEYWMSPTALFRMLRALRERRDRQHEYEILAQLQIDKPGELEIGKLYVIAGQGVMKLVNLYQPDSDRTTCNFITPRKASYWAAAEEVIREPDDEYLDLYIENNRQAGMHESADGVEQWRKEGP